MRHFLAEAALVTLLIKQSRYGSRQRSSVSHPTPKGSPEPRVIPGHASVATSTRGVGRRQVAAPPARLSPRRRSPLPRHDPALSSENLFPFRDRSLTVLCAPASGQEEKPFTN